MPSYAQRPCSAACDDTSRQRSPELALTEVNGYHGAILTMKPVRLNYALFKRADIDDAIDRA